MTAPPRVSGWPSGLRRCVQVAVSPGGVGSNPTSGSRVLGLRLRILALCTSGKKEFEEKQPRTPQLPEEGKGRCWSHPPDVRWQEVEEEFKAVSGEVRQNARNGIPALLRGWSKTAIGFPERWWVPQTCQWLRGFWTTRLKTYFNILSALNLSGSWWSLQVPAKWTFYSILKLKNGVLKQNGRSNCFGLNQTAIHSATPKLWWDFARSPVWIQKCC